MESIEYSIGHKRMKYLDLANLTFTQGEYEMALGYINAFMETIEENTRSAELIKEQFDNIEIKMKNDRKELKEHIKDMGELEKIDTKRKGELEIAIDGIHDKKTACWNIAMVEGLFND